MIFVHNFLFIEHLSTPVRFVRKFMLRILCKHKFILLHQTLAKSGSASTNVILSFEVGGGEDLCKIHA